MENLTPNYKVYDIRTSTYYTKLHEKSQNMFSKCRVL